MKHMKTRYFFIGEVGYCCYSRLVIRGKLGDQHIANEDQVADIMRNPLSKTGLEILRNKVGLF